MNKSLSLLLIALTAMVTSCKKAPAPAAAVQAGPLKEYWIGTNSKTLNLGTFAQPFDGSTRSKFDRLLPRIAGPCVVHLLPGVYWTWGRYGTSYLGNGVGLIGSGMTNTIIRLDTNCPVTTSGTFVDMIYADSRFNSNNVVSDLTVDGNYPKFVACGKINLHVNGVVLNGTHQRISRVTTTNLFVGTNIAGSNPEGWSLTIATGGALQTNACDGEVIEDCVVTKFYGPHQTDGIAFNSDEATKAPISGIMRGNTVTGVIEAFNGAWMVNSEITGNYVYECYDGLYGDTGTYSNLIVSANIFDNVQWGARFPCNGTTSLRRDNITFANNQCALKDGGAMIGIGTYGVGTIGPPFFNLVIRGNNVDYAPGASMNARLVWIRNVKGLTIVSNTIRSPFIRNEVAGCSSIRISDNVDWVGASYRLP